MTPAKLKACPFCGRRPKGTLMNLIGFFVGCWCTANGAYKSTEKAAIRAWNRRGKKGQ